MKKTSTLILTFCGGSLLLGCSNMSPWSQSAASSSSRIQARYDSAEAAYVTGRQLHRQGRLNEAAIAYEDALALDASHMETKNGMAALIAGRGDLDRAIVLLSSLAESHPDAPHILANLGYAYYLKGDVAAASHALDQAIKIAPDDENSWGKLAAVLDQHRLAGRNEAAETPDVTAAMEGPVSSDPSRVEIMPDSDGFYTLRYLGGSTQDRPTAIAQSVPVALLTESNPPENKVSPLPVTGALALEIANGNGVRGLARSLRELIKGDAWQVVRIVNHNSFKVPLTRIEYAEQYLPAARLLAEHMGVAAELRPHYRQSGAAVRVVLGHDFKSVQAMRQRQKNMPLACSSMMRQS